MKNQHNLYMKFMKVGASVLAFFALTLSSYPMDLGIPDLSLFRIYEKYIVLNLDAHPEFLFVDIWSDVIVIVDLGGVSK